MSDVCYLPTAHVYGVYRAVCEGDKNAGAVVLPTERKHGFVHVLAGLLLDRSAVVVVLDDVVEAQGAVPAAHGEDLLLEVRDPGYALHCVQGQALGVVDVDVLQRGVRVGCVRLHCECWLI